MHFSALKYFLETARLGSIRRAAEVLYVAPSAVSRQIALLEQKFGAPLFERHADGVRLTPAGRVFAAQAQSTKRDFERLQTEIDDLQQLRRGVVRIATVEATVHLLYETIRDFRKTYPGIEYDVRVLGSVKALASLAHEETEIALLFEPGVHADVVEDCAFLDPIVAVMPSQHPLADRKKVSIRELSTFRVAMLDETHVTSVLITRAYATEGLKPLVDMTLSTVGLVATYAREGLGLTFIPYLAVREDARAGRVKVAAIDNPMFQRTRFVLCRHKSRPPTLPAQAFLAALRVQITRLNTAKQVSASRRRK